MSCAKQVAFALWVWWFVVGPAWAGQNDWAVPANPYRLKLTLTTMVFSNARVS